MAVKKISALTAATSALGPDELPVNEAGTTKKVTLAQVLAYIQGALTVRLQKVETFTLSPTDVSNKYVTLSQTPVTAANVQACVKNNTPGVYTDDFVMSTSVRLSWSGRGWDGLVVSGDKITANYWY